MTSPADNSRDAQIEFDAARLALSQGDRKRALSGALMALALAPQEPAYRRLALSVLAVTTGYKTLPGLVLDALRECVADPTLDTQPLALVVKTTLEADPRLAAITSTLKGPADDIENAIASGAWNWLLNDPLVIGVLSRATNISLALEDVLCALRQHIATLASHQQESAALRYDALICAMILQLNTCRFAWPVSTNEIEIVKRTPQPFVHALYTPLDQLPAAAIDTLPEVLKAKRSSMLWLRDRAAQFAQLTPIDDHTSAAVRDQYEQFPYPPWDGLIEIQPTPWPRFVDQRFPGRGTPSQTPTILSAGCGTGRGALMLGVTFPDAAITAIDLSRSSLAFAAMKAEQLAVTTITFGVGDILQVASLHRRFDLIESSGVIHHMADPAAGLRALRAALNPQGLMRIAVYSQRGRSAVVAARHLLQAQDVADSTDGVRLARGVLRALPAGHPARPIVDTPEFFTIDGLHDLIFNVQEHRYTPLQLNALLESAQLQFLGFDFPDGQILSDFAHHHPAPAAMLDLAAWEDYEQTHPGTFAEMYQFWCAPRP